MGLSKTLYFTDKQNQMANIAKAMGHPASEDEYKKYRIDLIKGTIEGNALCYCINENTLNLLKSFIGEMEKKVISQKGNCC